MSTHHPALARRILKTLFDGTLGLLLLPTILLMIWGLAELGYNMLPGLLQDLVNWLFGHNGLGPFFLLVAAPFGFPFVAFLSFRYRDFRWRRDWWFVLIGEFLLCLVQYLFLDVLPFLGALWSRLLMFDVWVMYATTAPLLPILWLFYAVLRLTRKPSTES